jgi:general secretion pathway protein G
MRNTFLMIAPKKDAQTWAKPETSPDDTDSRGWTLVETLVVVAIIMTLSGAVGTIGMQQLQKTRSVVARTQVAALASALHAYYFDTGRYPTTHQGLAALWRLPTSPPVPTRWRGPYVDRAPTEDPWGNPFHYQESLRGDLPFSLMSFGADGSPGGVGNAADIDAWSWDE